MRMGARGGRGMSGSWWGRWWGVMVLDRCVQGGCAESLRGRGRRGRAWSRIQRGGLGPSRRRQSPGWPRPHPPRSAEGTARSSSSRGKSTACLRGFKLKTRQLPSSGRTKKTKNTASACCFAAWTCPAGDTLGGDHAAGTRAAHTWRGGRCHALATVATSSLSLSLVPLPSKF